MIVFLSLIPVFFSLVWFQRRLGALLGELREGRELLDCKGELENAYMKLCAFSLVWFWACLYFRVLGSAQATIVAQILWLSFAYVLYRRSETLLRSSGWQAERVNWPRVIRFWVVVIGAFSIASLLSRSLDAKLAAYFVQHFGPSYYGSGASLLVPMLLFLIEMFLFVALSPWFIALAIPSRRESDPVVVALVKQVFARGGLRPPRIVRLDTGKNLFAAVAGLPVPGPVLFLSDSLVSSLNSAELESVVAHELTHVHEGHLRKRITWFTALFALFLCYSGTVAVEAGVRAYSLGLLSWKASIFAIFLFTMAGFVGLFWALRKVVREQEAEADAFAVARFGADARALVSALDKVLAASGRSRNKQPIISYIFPAAAHPTVAEREKILYRAERRARFGLPPLRTRERAFVPYTHKRRLGLTTLFALSLWMVPAGVLQMHAREITAAFRYFSAIGDVDAMKYCLERGADARDPRALFRAVDGGHLRSVVLLVEAGADPNRVNSKGMSAYDLAWQKGHRELASYLDRVAGTHRPELREAQSGGRDLASDTTQK